MIPEGPRFEYEPAPLSGQPTISTPAHAWALLPFVSNAGSSPNQLLFAKNTLDTIFPIGSHQLACLKTLNQEQIAQLARLITR
ncbi:MAG: hypothetical protein DMG76_23665 [Acidobacteria bacterium]|nr:MAG: hypothetical protein DMG76_23665 [Acidobacteriota bacterium]